MALKKHILFNFIALIGFGFTVHSQESNPFAHLPKEERIKLADQYHDLSQNVYQTSEMHRMYKDSALMAVPDHVNYMQRASYSYKKSGEHIKAMEMLNKAVALDLANNHTAALEYKAWSMLYFYHDYENTIKDVELIEKVNAPEIYNSCHGEPCLLLKAQAYYQMGLNEKCVETIEKLLKIETDLGFEPTDNFLAYFYIARAHTKLKNYEKATFYYKEELATYDNFTEMHFYYGKLLLKQNDFANAEKHLLKAKSLLEKDTKLKEPYIERFDEVFMYQIDDALEELEMEWEEEF